MKQSRTSRIEWLLNNQSLWEGMPQETREFGIGGYQKRVQPLFIAMQEAGLYSLKTSWRDAGILPLINAARRQRRMKQAA